MHPVASPSRQIIFLTFLFSSLCWSVAAQSVSHKSSPLDSTKVYTYVERMPQYPGGGGLPALTTDLLREFTAASTAVGCGAPNYLVFVTLNVGPSGSIYGVRSINNLPLGVGTKRTLQELPAACESALVTAASRLPRLKPGRQNGRPVAVNFTLRLIAAPK